MKQSKTTEINKEVKVSNIAHSILIFVFINLYKMQLLIQTELKLLNLLEILKINKQFKIPVPNEDFRLPLKTECCILHL